MILQCVKSSIGVPVLTAKHQQGDDQSDTPASLILMSLGESTESSREKNADSGTYLSLACSRKKTGYKCKIAKCTCTVPIIVTTD